MFIFYTILLSLIAVRCEIQQLKDHSEFRQTITTKNVMVKFFSPNCGWCQRLAPTYVELSEKYNEQNPDTAIEFAEVDCSANQETCEAVDIRGFPTLRIYLKSENDIEYRGDRSFEDLSNFITIMQKPALMVVDTEDEAGILGAKLNKSAFFVFETSKKENELSDEIKDAMEQVAAAYKANTLVSLLCETGDDENITFVAHRDGRKVVFDKKFTPELITEAVSFIRLNHDAYLPELNSENFRNLLTIPNKLLTFIAIDPENEAQKKLIDEIKETIIADENALTSRIAPCWINGQMWISFVSKFLVTPEIFPAVVVIDVIGDHKQYYRYENLNSAQELITFAHNVVNGTEEAFPLEPARNEEKSQDRLDIDRKTEIMLSIFAFVNKHFILCAIIFSALVLLIFGFAIYGIVKCCGCCEKELEDKKDVEKFEDEKEEEEEEEDQTEKEEDKTQKEEKAIEDQASEK